MNFDKLISKHCLESAKIIGLDTDLRYYYSLGIVKTENYYHSATGTVEFITNPEGWLEKFSIIACPVIGGLLILVSPECPQVYIEETSDIVDLVKDYESERVPQIFSTIKNIVDSSVLNDGVHYEPGTLIYDRSSENLWISGYDNTLTSITPENVTYTAANSLKSGNITLNYTC